MGLLLRRGRRRGWEGKRRGRKDKGIEGRRERR